MTIDEAIEIVRQHNNACDDYYRGSIRGHWKAARKRLVKVNKELLMALTRSDVGDNDAERAVNS